MVKPEKNHEPDEVEKLLMNETQQQRYERYERYISPSSDLVKENNDKNVIKNEDELGETIKEEKPIEKHITRYIAKDNQREQRRSYYSNRDNNNRSNSYESRNFLPGDNDVYVSPTQIRKFNLKTGDILTGPCKLKTATDKFRALQYLVLINGLDPSFAAERPAFEKLTPIFPN